MLTRAAGRIAEALLDGLLAACQVLTGDLPHWRRQLRCIRHGHLFLCITDGHVCTRCGKFWRGA